MSSTVTYSLGISVLSLRYTWVIWILTSHIQCVYKVFTLSAEPIYIVSILFSNGVCPEWLWTQNAFTRSRNPPSLFEKPLERWWMTWQLLSLNVFHLKNSRKACQYIKVKAWTAFSGIAKVCSCLWGICEYCKCKWYTNLMLLFLQASLLIRKVLWPLLYLIT